MRVTQKIKAAAERHFPKTYATLREIMWNSICAFRRMCKPLQLLLARCGIVRFSGAAPEYKREEVARYAKKYDCTVLVETGTYLGQMVNAQLDNFDAIHSVEIMRNLYEDNVERFAGNEKVHLYCGDSSDLLPVMIDHALKDGKRIIFWLDGHYSGGITGKGNLECPIWAELDAIFSKLTSGFVILIDDARCFNGKGDYPRLKELETFFDEKGIHDFNVKSDITRVVVD